MVVSVKEKMRGYEKKDNKGRRKVGRKETEKIEEERIRV